MHELNFNQKLCKPGNIYIPRGALIKAIILLSTDIELNDGVATRALRKSALPTRDETAVPSSVAPCCEGSLVMIVMNIPPLVVDNPLLSTVYVTSTCDSVTSHIDATTDLKSATNSSILASLRLAFIATMKLRL